jgi:NAD(P)-dependent dehydrogenase (short-subunit alcohol dehydrogenase family)
MDDFSGKLALVTGAASGIGAAVSAALRGRGARVYAADLYPDGIAEQPNADPDLRAIRLDVRDEAAWTAAVDAVLSTDGRLDVLVNCVGVAAGSPLTDTEFAEWRRVMSVNLDGAFLATKHAMRAMRATGGAIVHVGSASGTRAAAGAAAYSTSKAALRMLVQTAAKECRDAGLPIRINIVSPAGVKTPMWSSMPFFQDLVRQHGSEDAAYAAMTKAGGGQFIEPEAVARVVCFLASHEAQHVTGVDLTIDDGYVL